MNKPDIVIDQYTSDEFGLLGKQIKQFLELFHNPEHLPYSSIVIAEIKRQRPITFMFETYIRNSYITNYGFSIITKELIDELKEFIGDRKVLEVMGGNGYLSRCLHEAGVDIICTDTNEWATSKKVSSRYQNWVNTWYPIEQLDAVEAIEKYNDRDVVIMSWPPYCEPTDVDVLNECLWRGKTLIYIGEGEGGCTGTDQFFEIVDDLGDKGKVRHNLYSGTTFDMLQFFGMHDQVFYVEPIKEGE